MTHRPAAIAALVVSLALAGTAPPGARADGGAGPSNVAVAVNTRDASSVVRIAFDVRRVSGSTVDPVNVAVAVASCTSCRTVAIAMQVVLVFGQPRTFTPVNLAVALNDACTDCQTLASAYQDVVQASTPLRLTPAGRRAIAAVRRALRSLASSALPIAAIQQQVDVLHAQLGG